MSNKLVPVPNYAALFADLSFLVAILVGICVPSCACAGDPYPIPPPHG